MLKLNQCRIMELSEKPIIAGVTVESEGAALVSEINTLTGREEVRPSRGVAEEIFTGFSYMHNKQPGLLTMVETITTPGSDPNPIRLLRNNLVEGQISARNLSTPYVPIVAPASITVDTEFLVDYVNGELLFLPGMQRELTITYKYRPTVQELKMMVPETDISIGNASAVTGSLGVITRGEVFTDMYDAAVNWVGVGKSIYLGVGGILTNAGPGPLISGHVTHVPSEDTPFLGIQFDVH